MHWELITAICSCLALIILIIAERRRILDTYNKSKIFKHIIIFSFYGFITFTSCLITFKFFPLDNIFQKFDTTISLIFNIISFPILVGVIYSIPIIILGIILRFIFGISENSFDIMEDFAQISVFIGGFTSAIIIVIILIFGNLQFYLEIIIAISLSFSLSSLLLILHRFNYIAKP